MPCRYHSIRPVQQFDPTACWAASLEWWARAIGNRTVVDQLNLLNVYSAYWDSRDPDTNPDYGTVSAANLKRILRDSRWSMDVAEIRPSSFSCQYVNSKMGHGPIIVGYYDTGVQGNHVVVSFGASATHVAVMDPNGARFRGHRADYFHHGSGIIVSWPTR